MLLVGPNGSGKSSLLRLLAGLLRPAGGSLFRKGQPISEEMESHLAMVRYVGHLDAVKPALSVAETLMFWGGFTGLGQRQAEAAAAAAMTCFGLERLADVPGRLLSAGQKRRVNLARLLLGTSDLWLLDEPATALDQTAVAALGMVMAEHRAHGGMVVLSTHTAVALSDAQRLDMRDFAADPLTAAHARPGNGP
ncbi:MAG: heme exporter protein A [Rhodospirillaceae bacterium]|nr:MAG: heme exporter protein A [Rhodospirillaceae bacterium]